MIICPQTSIEQATRLAERIRDQVQHFSFHCIGHRTLSFGVSEFRDNDNSTSLTSRADTALYQAKKLGRNRVCSEASPSNNV